MKYQNGQVFVSNYIMESYEIIGFNPSTEKYNLNIYGENGKPEDFIGSIELMESVLNEHYTMV